MTSRDFLQLLWANKPEDRYVLIWTLKGKESRWFRSVASAAEFVEKTCKVDIYVGVGLSSTDRGPDHRCTSADIVGIAGLWADFDIRSDAHDKALPTTVEEALSLIPAAFPPTVVIVTGNGIHCWWLLKEPWAFESEEERLKASSLIYRFQTLLLYNSNQRGWVFERLADLARVLRIPGTINGKDPSNRKNVAAYSVNGHRYNPSDFSEYLDDLSIPDDRTAQHEGIIRSQRFSDKPLVINPAARISSDQIELWMESDLRFKNTWFRQRHDLADQSQSGYDMSLACFGQENGLSDQDIVDLITHHRYFHKQKSRTSLDYFERTISKAFTRTDDPQASAKTSLSLTPANGPCLNDHRGGTHSGTSNEPANVFKAGDPLLVKAKLCDQLSQVLGVRIIRLIKISGKQPVFRMELESGMIQFPSVSALIVHKSLLHAIAGEVGHIIPTFKRKTWESVAQMLLDAVSMEEGGEETTLKGAARVQVEQYLSEIAFIASVEGQSYLTARRPIVVNGNLTVSASDIQFYLGKTGAEKPSAILIAGMLSVLGAKNFRYRPNRHVDQSRWTLPRIEFDPADFAQGWEVGFSHDEN